MRDWLNKLIDVTAVGTTETNLKAALAFLATQLGFDGYAYHNVRPHQSFAISKYQHEWQSLYLENNYQAIDPIVMRAKSLRGTFVWSGQEGKSHLTKEQRAFYAHADDFGIRSGVTIPIRTPNGHVSMFTLVSGRISTSMERDINPVAAAAAVGQLHARITSLKAAPTIEEEVRLDPKAVAYLR